MHGHMNLKFMESVRPLTKPQSDFLPNLSQTSYQTSVRPPTKPQG